MRKEEKTRISRERILQAAIREFGENSYEQGSMNSICENNGLSKGLIYHNFKNKDDLYICALRRCTEEMIKYIEEGVYPEGSIKEKVLSVFTRRKEFFDKEPTLKKLFYYSVYMPPQHLAKELRDIRRSYLKVITDLMSSFSFRNGVTMDFVLEYLMLASWMVIRYTLDNTEEDADILSLAEAHEKNMNFFADSILYGIAEQE